MSEYKTFEELKEELGDKFEDYMYKANIELLNKLQQKENIIKEVREHNQYIIDVINDIEDGNRLVELLNENNDILNKVDRNE